MRIKSLELVECNRLNTKSIQRFVIRPKQLVQLILGSNGSGKSSIVKMLTPLPPDKEDFRKNGWKFIEIEHRGSDYALKSTFEQKTPHHSFIKDGEEQNPGGTVGAFMTLCEKEFNLTPDVHKLLTDEITFTQMGATKRREWFTRLSDISYDFALSIFGKLKDYSRDTTGALRNNKKRIVIETAKIISAEEEGRLRKDVEETTKELRLLISQSAPLDRPVSTYQENQRSILDELHRLSQRLVRLKVAAPYGVTDPYSIDPRRPVERDEWRELIYPVFSSIEDIDSLVDQLRHEATSKETLINKAVQEHTKLEEMVAILERTGKEGVASLQEKMRVQRQERDEVLSRRKLHIEGINARDAISALNSVQDILTEVFGAIPSNEDKRYSRVRLQELQEQHDKLKHERAQKLQKQTMIIARRSHLESHKDAEAITCPKCVHSWRPGYDAGRIAEYNAHIQTLEDEMVAIDKQVVDVHEEIVKIQEYSTMYRDYMNCVRNWPVLQPFWNYLTESDYVITSPRKALSEMGVFRADLELERQAAKIEDSILETMKLIESAQKVGDADLTDTKHKLDDCSLQISTMTAALTELRGKIGNYMRYRSQVLEAESLSKKIKDLMVGAEKCTADMVEMMRRETLSHCIDKLSHTLAVKQDTLNAANTQRALIVSLENEIKRLTTEEEAAKALVVELSPTDGLIAEGLFGFIRKFNSQMNTLIRKIWAYPLKVLDCGVAGSTGAELDYKFPLMVNKESNVVSDVSKGSSGMIEIVDLAFKVTAMFYLGLQESPLYMDEFGKTFDEVHRTQAMHVIKSLLDQKPFTQLFMISHYESTHGSFTNAEICVTCPNNITTPAESKYNQHVTIEY